jgi:predicted MPP superfamily phosphohydrolase
MKVSFFSIKTGKIKNNAGFRIVHLSDLHKKQFGEDNSELFEKICSLRPDAVFITGDMISRSTQSLEVIKSLLKRLSDVFPVYYSLGNHETDTKTTNPVIYKELTEYALGLGILLDNKTVRIENENLLIQLSGLTIYDECYKKDGCYKNLRSISAAEVKALLKTEPQKNCINIMLAHNPVFFEAYSDYGSDIILSGHIHGGCIKLPFIGGLLSPERKFFPKYFSGLYKRKNSSMIVSCGLGKFRLFNPSEIVVLELS